MTVTLQSRLRNVERDIASLRRQQHDGTCRYGDKWLRGALRKALAHRRQLLQWIENERQREQPKQLRLF